MTLALYPGLLNLAFVACSTNVGEGLVKLITCNDLPGRVEEWHIPGKITSDALVITNTDHRTTEHSISDSVGDLSWVQKVPLQLYRRNLPHLHISRYVISSTRPSPMLVLQVTTAEVRWPGYKATIP